MLAENYSFSINGKRENNNQDTIDKKTKLLYLT